MSDQAAPTDTSASSELKAGHAPAIKVGGMRVSAPRPRHTSQGEDKTADAEGDQETSGDNEAAGGASNPKDGEGADEEETTRTVASRAAGEMVSGTFVPIQKAFPTEAVKNTHDRPGTHPKHESHAYVKSNDQHYINQPRKQ